MRTRASAFPCHTLCACERTRVQVFVWCVYVKTALVQTSTRRTAATRCLLPLHIIICILCVRVMSHPQHALMHFSSHSLSLVSGLVASVRARENGVRMKRETNKWLRTECRFSTKHSINKFAEHHRFHIFSLFLLLFNSILKLFFIRIQAIFHSCNTSRSISSFAFIFFACVKRCAHISRAQCVWYEQRLWCTTSDSDYLTAWAISHRPEDLIRLIWKMENGKPKCSNFLNF